MSNNNIPARLLNSELTAIYDNLEQIQWSIEGLSQLIIESTAESHYIAPVLAQLSLNLENQVNALHKFMTR
jgi:hypothetical protein